MKHRNPYEPPVASLDMGTTAASARSTHIHWRRALWLWLILLVLPLALVSPTPQGVFGAVGCAGGIYFARLKKWPQFSLCVAAMVGLGFAMAVSMQAVGVGLVLVYLALLLLCHVSLGRAASVAGKSWVLFGLLPFLWPVLGAAISLAVLRARTRA